MEEQQDVALGCLNPFKATLFLYEPTQGKASEAWNWRGELVQAGSSGALWMGCHGAGVSCIKEGGLLTEARAALTPGS